MNYRPIRRGDLVVTDDGYYALVKEVLPGRRLLVRLADGLVRTYRVADVTQQGMGPYCGRDGGLSLGNFQEEMPAWADPYSPRFRPPPAEDDDPDWEPEGGAPGPVLDGRYACPECLEDIDVDALGRPIEAVKCNGGAVWYHRECMVLHVSSHQVRLCACYGPRPAGETRRQTARLCWERVRAAARRDASGRLVARFLDEYGGYGCFTGDE